MVQVVYKDSRTFFAGSLFIDTARTKAGFIFRMYWAFAGFPLDGTLDESSFAIKMYRIFSTTSQRLNAYFIRINGTRHVQVNHTICYSNDFDFVETARTNVTACNKSCQLLCGRRTAENERPIKLVTKLERF